MAKKIDPSVPHPAFPEMHHKYEICEDAFDGKVTEYVELLDDQTKDERALYVQRAAYFGVVQPTVSALIGAMTRKPYVLEGEFPLNDYGNTDTFIQENLKSLLLGARTTLVVSVEDGKSKIVAYDADDVINWSKNFVVIKEYQLVPDADNPFLQVKQCWYRELYLDEEGFFRSRAWYEVKGKWVPVDLEDLVVNGSLLAYLPVFVANQYNNTWDTYTPPLFTQSGLNIQHFKQSCDLAHYSHFMALPTPYIAGDLANYGVAEDGTQIQAKVKLGSTKEVLHLDQGAQVGYMEVSGASFTMLRDNLKDIEERMFIAGSRLLTTKKGVESAEALQLRSGSESAVLETMTNAFESALNQALALCGEIDRDTKSIQLNKDFTAAVADPAHVKALLELYTANVITLDQFLTKLVEHEVVAPVQPTV